MTLTVYQKDGFLAGMEFEIVRDDDFDNGSRDAAITLDAAAKFVATEFKKTLPMTMFTSGPVSNN